MKNCGKCLEQNPFKRFKTYMYFLSSSPKVASFSFLQVAGPTILARVTNAGMNRLLTVLALCTNTHIQKTAAC